MKSKLMMGVLFALMLMGVTATAQKKGKWVTLFDGKTMNGWRGYNMPGVPNAWTIEDGALKINAKSPATNERGDLLFDKKFKNFELQLMYKVDKGANSGILYLGQELPGKKIYQSAPEYQVLDNENHPDAKAGKNGNRKSASLYDMIPATPQVDKGFGQWNEVRIIIKDGHVQHYLNGKKVVEYTLWNEDWKNMVLNSKFKDWADFMNAGGDTRSGYIALQDHGNNVWFKNIKLREL
jgi:hypothetical protein